MRSIVQATEQGTIAATVQGVISDRADAPGLAFAKRRGLPCHIINSERHTKESFDSTLFAILSEMGAEVIALAGFMRIVGAVLVKHYEGHILNIHPSLLPAYKGLNTHQRVLDDQQSEHGCSVHFVNQDLDGGAVVMQARIIVNKNDTAATLADRVLHYEHLIYPQSLALLCAGRLQLQGKQCLLDGHPLLKPLEPYKKSE